MKIRFAQSHRSDRVSLCKVYTFWYVFSESTSEHRVQRRDCFENHDLMKTAVFKFSNKKYLYFANIVNLA